MKKTTSHTAHEIEATSSLASAIVAYGHLPTSQVEAERLGCDMYFTRKSCGSGHFSPRYTKNKACMRCAKEHVERTRMGVSNSEKERFMYELEGIQKERADEALAAYLMYLQGKGVVPGVVYFDRVDEVPPFSGNWKGVFKQAEQSGAVVSCDGGRGFFFPRILQANFPRTVARTQTWRKLIENQQESDLKTFVIDHISETIQNMLAEPGFTLQKRNMISIWSELVASQQAATEQALV